MLNRAMNVLESKREKKPLGADELFGQSIGESLKEIVDVRWKEFVKLKIQELIFNAKVGLLSIPTTQNLFSPTQQSRTSHNSSMSMPTPRNILTPSYSSSSSNHSSPCPSFSSIISAPMSPVFDSSRSSQNPLNQYQQSPYQNEEIHYSQNQEAISMNWPSA